MRTRIVRFGAAALLLALVVLLVGTASSQSCVENTGLFAEDFRDGSDLDEAASSVQYWYNDRVNPRDIMTLNRVGANFDTANPSYVPAWINALTANDFDLDGWPDYIGTSSSYSNVLAFVRNLGGAGRRGNLPNRLLDRRLHRQRLRLAHRRVWAGRPSTTEGHVGMTSGDYDGDGDFDFVLIVSTTAGDCDLKRVWLYENTLISGGRNTGTVAFVRTDLTSAWSGTVGGIAWSATVATSLDFDGDGDIDILTGNRDGEVLKATNTGNGRVNAATFVVESTPLVATGWGDRGVSTVSAAEFDGSPGIDIIVGSVSTADLRFYRNDGTGQLSLAASFSDGSGNLSNNLYDGGATVSLSNDFDRDGDVDLIIGTDNWNYGGDGYGGKCYYFKNGGSADFVVKLVFDGPGKSPRVYDFDLGAVFDFDNDGDVDFLIADGNDSQYYYLFVNELADVYNTQGTGLSLNLTPTLTGRQYAITKVRLTAIDQRVIGSSSSGLRIDYWVTNNDGRNWEFYAGYGGSSIANVTNQPWHDFHTYGSSLRWKAVLTAAEDAMTEYEDASLRDALGRHAADGVCLCREARVLPLLGRRLCGQPGRAVPQADAGGLLHLPRAGRAAAGLRRDQHPRLLGRRLDRPDDLPGRPVQPHGPDGGDGGDHLLGRRRAAEEP